MKKKNKIICIIPALEKNNYSDKGDLVSWGDTTLLEWKLAQIRDLKFPKDIVVATPSNKISKICKKYDVKILIRKKNLKLSELHKFIGKTYRKKQILWLNPTAPFLKNQLVEKFVKKFQKRKKNYDSAFTCIEKREYFFKKNKSINFSSYKLAVSRKKIIPFYQATNGAFLITSEHLKKTGSLFGYKPLMYKIDWLSSLEIKSATELENYRFLISKYFNK